jgi:hypothetical protein
MKKLLTRLIWAPVGFMLVVFLVANRQLVSVSLDPFSAENPAVTSPPLPLWTWLAAALLIGFFVGAAGMWMSLQPRRRKEIAVKRELKALKRGLADRPPASDDLPALPSASS